MILSLNSRFFTGGLVLIALIQASPNAGSNSLKVCCVSSVYRLKWRERNDPLPLLSLGMACVKHQINAG